MLWRPVCPGGGGGGAFGWLDISPVLVTAVVCSFGGGSVVGGSLFINYFFGSFEIGPLK